MRTASLEPRPLLDAIVEDVAESARELRCAATARLVKHGVSMTQMHILAHLDTHGDQPMSRLAEFLDVSLSNATGLVDRMAERGYVERLRVPDDRRLVLVRLADGGRQVLERAQMLRQDHLRAILARLDDRQLERLRETVGDIRAAIAAESVHARAHDGADGTA